jgi:hypothetical protein
LAADLRVAGFVVAAAVALPLLRPAGFRVTAFARRYWRHPRFAWTPVLHVETLLRTSSGTRVSKW